jgi:flagellar protein FliS
VTPSAQGWLAAADNPHIPFAEAQVDMVPARAAQAYARIGLETGVASASPERLIVMLYDGAIAALNQARVHMNSGETALKGQAIGKAIAIVDEGLKAAVDTSKGGAIARQLVELYDYIGRRLLVANLRNDTALVDESARLLGELRGAWQALAERQGVPA